MTSATDLTVDPPRRPTIRMAGPADAQAMLEIYADYVRTTPISFETDAPAVEEFARRVTDVLAYGPWLVCEVDGVVAGYAYGSPFRTRAAYRWSVETTVYIARGKTRAGIGRALYDALFSLLRAQGFRLAIAGITLPNPASVGLHERVGFRPVGVYHAVGNKSGEWHDVGFWELELQQLPAAVQPPIEPRQLDPALVSRTCAAAAASIRG